MGGKERATKARPRLSQLVLSDSTEPSSARARLPVETAVSDTQRTMPEESTTPDLVEIVRRANDAWNRRDVDAWLGLLSPDIVLRPISTFTDSQERRGLDAGRRFWDEWNDA